MSGIHEEDGWAITAGRHRFEAAHRLNLETIPCIVQSGDDLHAELTMIDENLIRASLTPAQEDEAVSRRKLIYEKLHPETKAGVAGAMAKHGYASDKLSFAESTAKVVGKDRRSVERSAARGSQSRIKEIVGTTLDKGTELAALAKMEKTDPVKRDDLINKAVAGENVSAIVKKKRAPPIDKQQAVRKKPALLPADPIEDECVDCNTDEERWQRSLENLAGESASIPAYWTR